MSPSFVIFVFLVVKFFCTSAPKKDGEALLRRRITLQEHSSQGFVRPT